MSIQEVAPLWQEVHARLFSTPADRWWETYAIWSRLFSVEGWTDEQLADAVYRVARRAVLPQFAPQHLQSIREELVASAHEASSIRRKAFESENCSICRGTGWVLDLPHLEHVKGGRWLTSMGVYYTQAVCCSCGKGQAIKSAVTAHWTKDPLKEGASPLGLNEYITRNPGYVEQMEIRRQIREADREMIKQKNVSSKNDATRERLQEAMSKIGRKVR